MESINSNDRNIYRLFLAIIFIANYVFPATAASNDSDDYEGFLQRVFDERGAKKRRICDDFVASIQSSEKEEINPRKLRKLTVDFIKRTEKELEEELNPEEFSEELESAVQSRLISDESSQVIQRHLDTYKDWEKGFSKENLAPKEDVLRGKISAPLAPVGEGGEGGSEPGEGGGSEDADDEADSVTSSAETLLSHINAKIQEAIERAARERTEMQLSVAAARDNVSIGDLLKYMNEHIIGEERAMEALAAAIERHVVSAAINEQFRKEGKRPPIRKNNILLVGPTGCGKTESVSILSRQLGLPFVTGDASTLTRTGYVGDSASSVINRLLLSVGGNAKKAEEGIIFIDEIDKIASSPNERRDIAGGDVQSELLKLIEGKEVVVEIESPLGRKEEVTVDTSKILFIAGGAFSELKKDKKIYTPQDFVDIGFKPELLGRFGEIIPFEGLTLEKMRKILKSPMVSPLNDNSILFSLGYGIRLDFTDEAIDLIAERAITLKMGVRGLVTIASEVVRSLFKRADTLKGQTVVIDEAFIKENLPDDFMADHAPSDDEGEWKGMFN